MILDKQIYSGLPSFCVVYVTAISALFFRFLHLTGHGQKCFFFSPKLISKTGVKRVIYIFIFIFR